MTRPQAARARMFLAGVSTVAVLACNGVGAALPQTIQPPVSDEDAMQFSSRAERFYHLLEGLPLVATLTFDNRELHPFFQNPSSFADYYSALAMVARQNALRDRQVRSVVIREFHFLGPDQAVVEVVFTGKHERELRFWDIHLDRHDIWRRIDGIWLIVPEKL
jgi:hypothetical protein